MQRKEGLDLNNFFIGNCDITKKQKKILYKNPHCIEYFCTINKIKSCTNCASYIMNNKKLLWNSSLIKKTSFDDKYCKSNCKNGFIYDYIERPDVKLNTFNIDKYKNNHNFYNDKLIYKLEDLPQNITYENTFPKPKTVIHWGQLKMLLVVIIFLMNIINSNDKNVHIIYAGSARGDNISILCKMFPNTIWHLIDPRKHLKELYNNKQIHEIRTEYFTNDVAEEYYNKFKDRDFKLLFISDIREDTSDESIIKDNQMQIDWHKILQPDFSYFKFRCGYDTNRIYKYYKGTIFLQIYAPASSTETRIMFPKNLETYDYNIEDYQGKLLYFNRVIRPSYHIKSIISENDYFDHCYDCTYYSYVIKNYIKKFPDFNPFNTTDIYKIMKSITNKIAKYTQDKIFIHNRHFLKNL